MTTQIKPLDSISSDHRSIILDSVDEEKNGRISKTETLVTIFKKLNSLYPYSIYKEDLIVDLMTASGKFRSVESQRYLESKKTGSMVYEPRPGYYSLI